MKCTRCGRSRRYLDFRPERQTFLNFCHPETLFDRGLCKACLTATDDATPPRPESAKPLTEAEYDFHQAILNGRVWDAKADKSIEEVNQKLLPRVLAGDENAINAMIVNNLPIGQRLANALRKDDCDAKSEANKITVREIQKIAGLKKEIDNVVGFIITAQRRRLLDWRLEDELIGPSASTRKKEYAKNKSRRRYKHWSIQKCKKCGVVGTNWYHERSRGLFCRECWERGAAFRPSSRITIVPFIVESVDKDGNVEWNEVSCARQYSSGFENIKKFEELKSDLLASCACAIERALVHEYARQFLEDGIYALNQAEAARRLGKTRQQIRTLTDRVFGRYANKKKLQNLQPVDSIVATIRIEDKTNGKAKAKESDPKPLHTAL